MYGHYCSGMLGVQCGSGEHVVGLEGFYLRLGMFDEGFIVVVTLSVVNYQPASYLHATLIHPRILHVTDSCADTAILSRASIQTYVYTVVTAAALQLLKSIH